jgi:hypothetical protein
MAVTELEINGQNIQLVKKVSELENDAEYQSKTQVENIVNSAIEQTLINTLNEIEYGTY